MHSLPLTNAVFELEQRPSQSWRGWALGGFLLLSALAHALLLLLPTQPPLPEVEGLQRGVLQVRMETAPVAPAAAPDPASRTPTALAQPATPVATAQAAAPTQPQQQAPPPARQPPAQRPAAARAAPPQDAAQATAAETRPRSTPTKDASARAEPRALASTADEFAKQEASTPASSEPAGTAAAEPSLADRLQARLQHSLRAYFDYPRIARHRGWEGRVEVGLRVEANGRLSDIRVLRTSGYAVLDRAALASVGRIHRLRGAAEWLGGRPMDMVLPVQYRLIDG